jgi:hypothetical protein
VLKLILCRYANGFVNFELFRYKYRKHAKALGITSQWVYLWKADAFWGVSAAEANHQGAPLGNIEKCLRKSNYTLIRYNNQTSAISFLRRSFIETYYRPEPRDYFLTECSRV